MVGAESEHLSGIPRTPLMGRGGIERGVHGNWEKARKWVEIGELVGAIGGENQEQRGEMRGEGEEKSYSD